MYINLHDFNDKKEVYQLMKDEVAYNRKWAFFWDTVFFALMGLSYYQEVDANLLWIFGGLYVLKSCLIISIEGINLHYFLRTIDYLNAQDQ